MLKGRVNTAFIRARTRTNARRARGSWGVRALTVSASVRENPDITTPRSNRNERIEENTAVRSFVRL
jgi:hypothetical protein